MLNCIGQLHRKIFILLVASLAVTGVFAEVSSQQTHAKQADELQVKKGSKVAIIGDSITEQKIYSRYMELYMTVCVPQLDLKVMQYGWGGETAPGFANRMEHDILAWRPDVATTCYGMNDGSYRAYEDSIGKRYADGMNRVVSFMKVNDINVIVGSPGVVDTGTWRTNNLNDAVVYNENLKQLSEIAKEIAQKEGFVYSDVHGAMAEVMRNAKAEYGPKYHIAGSDGVHPWQNGHLVMAYSFLKSMGFGEKIAEIRVDIDSNKAQASSGHEILSEDITPEKAVVEIDSSRYPFCFQTDKANDDPWGTVGILPFIGFQDDLNVFELKVANLPSERAMVKWGSESRVFTKAQLEEGINLSSEFLSNPFSNAFEGVEREVAKKQAFETEMVKRVFFTIRDMKYHFEPGEDLDDTKELGEQIIKQYLKRHQKLHDDVKSAFKPVKHTIEIIPEQHAGLVTPKVAPTFIALLPGAVKPEGWLNDWARSAAEGITGHLDERAAVYAEGYKGTSFKALGVGPNGTGWPLEQCAYWLDGLVRLAYILDDEVLIKKAQSRLDLVVDGVLEGGESFVYWQPKDIQQLGAFAHGQGVGGVL